MFDFIIGNPPFNISQQNNIAGTGGNTTLYKTIIKHSLKFLNETGKLIYISPKSIIRSMQDKIIYFNLMDDIDVWSYDTCFLLLIITKIFQ
jgi:tRNA1(Val) A37 N6-methylase TrmN6